MNNDSDKTFYTATMARVHADQGRYGQAARIYRYLLEQEPDREDLRKALEAVSALLTTDHQAVKARVQQWVALMLRRKTLHQLQNTRLPADHRTA